MVELADSLDSGSSAHSGRAGSSPASRTIKETSFVCQGKRGFFLHFGQKPSKYRQNRDQIGLQSGFAAASEPDFCVSGAKWLVYFCLSFTPAKDYEKGQGVGI